MANLTAYKYFVEDGLSTVDNLDASEAVWR
jgi:hypothetical protein